MEVFTEPANGFCSVPVPGCNVVKGGLGASENTGGVLHFLTSLTATRHHQPRELLLAVLRGCPQMQAAFLGNFPFPLDIPRSRKHSGHAAESDDEADEAKEEDAAMSAGAENWLPWMASIDLFCAVARLPWQISEKELASATATLDTSDTSDATTTPTLSRADDVAVHARLEQRRKHAHAHAAACYNDAVALPKKLNVTLLSKGLQHPVRLVRTPVRLSTGPSGYPSIGLSMCSLWSSVARAPTVCRLRRSVTTCFYWWLEFWSGCFGSLWSTARTLLMLPVGRRDCPPSSCCSPWRIEKQRRRRILRTREASRH